MSEIPSNIKQIGSISNDLRVYIEDYAFTYIKQYALMLEGEEKIAVLTGYEKNIDNKDVIFINGVIKANYTKRQDAMECFTDYSFKEIKDNMERFFPNSTVVGWAYIQPGYGDYINDRQVKYHLENFSEKNQLLLILDPLEKITCFYHSENSELKPLKGYFVYYDKNENMHEYMLENKLSEDKKVIAESENEISTRTTININKKNPRLNKAYVKQARTSSMYMSLCAVLFLVMFVMGSTLIQSDGKIKELETKLTELDNSYKYILNEYNMQKTQSVFASQSPTPETQEATTQMTTQMITQMTTQTNENKEIKEYAKYEVQDGDTLNHISIKFYGNNDRVKDIMLINDITNPDAIFSGKIIKLP